VAAHGFIYTYPRAHVIAVILASLARSAAAISSARSDRGPKCGWISPCFRTVFTELTQCAF